jgi:hypothetical protein
MTIERSREVLANVLNILQGIYDADVKRGTKCLQSIHQDKARVVVLFALELEIIDGPMFEVLMEDISCWGKVRLGCT